MSFKYGIPTVSRRDFLKGGALGMAIVSGAALAGCDNGGGEQTPAGGDSGSKGVGIAVATAPITLDPLAALDTISMTFISQGLECLFEKDAEGEIKPAACESYEVSDDQLTWTFTLRDATWSNGDPVVADDFICSWQRNAQADSGVADFQYQIEMAAIKNYAAVLDGSADVSELGISAPDDKTIVIELEHPVPFMLDLLSFTPWAPVNRAFREEKGDMFGITKDDQIYNGPFTVTQYDSAANTFVLTKNEGYWDVDNVALDTVTFQVIPETQQAVMAYESGTVDYVELTGDLVAQYQDNEAFGTWDGQFNYYLMMNTTREGMNNENFRRAIACAINREDICSSILKDGSEPVQQMIMKGLFFNEAGEDFAEASPQPNGYDLEQAQQFWEAAQAETDVREFTLLFDQDKDFTQDACAYIQDTVQKALPGLTINLEATPKKSRTDRAQSGDFDVCLWGWGPDYADPTAILAMYESNHPSNYSRWVDEEFDTLYEQANSTDAGDADARWDELMRCNEICSTRAVSIPIFQTGLCTLTRPEVTGMGHHITGTQYFCKYMDKA